MYTLKEILPAVGGGNSPPHRTRRRSKTSSASRAGARSVQAESMSFCKDFNARTQKYKPDMHMAVTISAFQDNTFEFTVKFPSVTWYLKKAAGIQSGSSRSVHVSASTITVKHVYEIAKIKQSDPYCQYMSLEAISRSIIGTTNFMGIKVQKELD